MNMSGFDWLKIEPELMQRRCGGWLAGSPSHVPLRFAVTADTEAEARDKFRSSLDSWVSLLTHPTEQTATSIVAGRPARAPSDGEIEAAA